MSEYGQRIIEGAKDATDIAATHRRMARGIAWAKANPNVTMNDDMWQALCAWRAMGGWEPYPPKTVNINLPRSKTHD